MPRIKRKTAGTAERECSKAISRRGPLSPRSLAGNAEELQEIQAAGRELKIPLQPCSTPDPSPIWKAPFEMGKGRVDALISAV